MASFKKIDEARRLFGLPEHATLVEVKNRYRRLASQYHPDRCSEKDKKRCEAMFKKITHARDVLLNYCAAYRCSFKEEDVKRVTMDEDILSEHIRRFYEDWII